MALMVGSGGGTRCSVFYQTGFHRYCGYQCSATCHRSANESRSCRRSHRHRNISIGKASSFDPKNDIGYAANFLRMCFSVPCEEYKSNTVMARAMDPFSSCTRSRAECSTSDGAAVRGSPAANPFACIARLRLPVGTSHGGQRGGAEDACRIGTVKSHPRSSSSGPTTRTTASA